GDGLQLSPPAGGNGLGQAHRELPEWRAVLGEAPDTGGTIGVFPVPVVVVSEPVRPRLAGAVFVNGSEGELPREMNDAADHQAIALRAARAAVLRLHVR